MAKPRKRHEGDQPLSDPSAASGSSNGNGSHSGSPDPERISMRAYELYLARGGADGQAVEDWLTAERELAGKRSSSQGSRGE